MITQNLKHKTYNYGYKRFDFKLHVPSNIIMPAFQSALLIIKKLKSIIATMVYPGMA